VLLTNDRTVSKGVQQPPRSVSFVACNFNQHIFSKFLESMNGFFWKYLVHELPYYVPTKRISNKINSRVNDEYDDDNTFKE
jgi:hypothetical protein